MKARRRKPVCGVCAFASPAIDLANTVTSLSFHERNTIGEGIYLSKNVLCSSSMATPACIEIIARISPALPTCLPSCVPKTCRALCQQMPCSRGAVNYDCSPAYTRVCNPDI